mmetsp:Transcript_27230/g.69337  ORF Transcript_27230/g.69337 Transcript_27230/m.69337 type:complete len:217 (-) Transcript_27230:788-1438(-)
MLPAASVIICPTCPEKELDPTPACTPWPPRAPLCGMLCAACSDVPDPDVWCVVDISGASGRPGWGASVASEMPTAAASLLPLGVMMVSPVIPISPGTSSSCSPSCRLNWYLGGTRARDASCCCMMGGGPALAGGCGGGCVLCSGMAGGATGGGTVIWGGCPGRITGGPGLYMGSAGGGAGAAMAGGGAGPLCLYRVPAAGPSYAWRSGMAPLVRCT